ncbi:MAG: alpha/beta hydrolase [Candidatus Binatia bacterium]|nr:alpha/beta hydrolase [Candidatus Binatia bacterium]
MRRGRPRPIAFEGAKGLTLQADVYGDPNGTPVVLLHGGGQTRHSWSDTACALAEDGWQVVALDQRGHGESDWAKDQQYQLQDYAADIVELIPQLAKPPVLVGASLGGLAALLAQGESEGDFAIGLILVDVAPRMERDGVERILEFMKAHSDGFATLDECADAVAAYNPNRPRPKSSEGLAKNLRKGDDGRWRWHWDPGFVGIDRQTEGRDDMIDDAARAVDIPTLLVRGRQSDLLSEEGARHFLELVPHAKFVDVSGAGHMVAGDNNDVFTDSVRAFLNELRGDVG